MFFFFLIVLNKLTNSLFSRGAIYTFYVYQVDVLILGILEFSIIQTQLHESLVIMVEIYPFVKLH